jgi:hypothetical protein
VERGGNPESALTDLLLNTFIKFEQLNGHGSGMKVIYERFFHLGAEIITTLETNDNKNSILSRNQCFLLQGRYCRALCRS